ncbi:hypothetical protein LNTAR_06324 [Lentisphaera araneosa HTCC2155]|uniref:Uncharacterized protein n=1 Tax=Lentisphaera araneosa HTCC2155 TaxID=313628 RepID=A6DN91_9BACT|nr:hypothetical protein [Lentisphaera araneosa]EDM26839.1 hypothetical protein LNTAR_06324 [Lentisphaera araneosa HTCC2155]
MTPFERTKLNELITICESVFSLVEDMREYKIRRNKPLRTDLTKQIILLANSVSNLKKVNKDLIIQILEKEELERLIKFGEVLALNHEKIDFGIVWRSTQDEIPSLYRKTKNLITIRST